MSKKIITIIAIFSLTVLIGCVPQQTETPEVTADTLLDDQLFAEAAINNNLTRCAQISVESKAEECEDMVNANLITLQAVATTDASMCEDIELERYKENCESQVGTKIEAEQEAERMQAEMESSMKLSLEAYESQDVSMCEQLEDESLKYSCVYDIVANQALEQNDASLCEEIGDEEYVNDCEELFVAPVLPE